jgi:DNA-binding transcriptional LysR family regulator
VGARLDIDQLDFRKLRAFHLVVKHGCLRRAALRLGITIPAVSLSIRRLEEQVGVQLFQRLPNKLVLTGAGERLAQAVEVILEDIRGILRPLASQPAPRGRLSMSINSDLASYFIPKIAAFIKSNPDVDLRVDIQSSTDALRLVEAGDLDLSIGRFGAVPKAIECEPVIESSISLVYPANHPMLRGRRPKIEEIARCTLVTLPSRHSTRRIIDTAFAKVRLKTQSRIEAGNCQTICDFVEQGVGVGLIHSLCARREPKGRLRYADLSHCFGSVGFSAIYRRTTGASPALTAMLEVCTSEART